MIKHNYPERLNSLHPIMTRERTQQMMEWNEDPNIGAGLTTILPFDVRIASDQAT